MDVIAHGLWAGAAAVGLGRTRSVSRADIAGAILLGVAPDAAQLMPVLAWSLSQPDTVAIAYAFITALPGKEPSLPPLVILVSHHLHCVTHSAVIAAVIGLIAWRMRGSLWVPLVGWWLHIALDIPTHSDAYYAVPFLYPIADWVFDGVPWTTPWLLALNYLALAGAGWFLFVRKPGRARIRQL